MELRMCVRSLECEHGAQGVCTEPGVCPWSSECEHGAWSVSRAQSVSLEPGSGVWPGYQRTEAGHWLQPRMGSEIPKAGSAPGSAPGHGLSPPPAPQPVPHPGPGPVRPPRCLPSPPSPTLQPPQPAHCSPPSRGQRGGLAPLLGWRPQCRRWSPLPRGAPWVGQAAALGCRPAAILLRLLPSHQDLWRLVGGLGAPAAALVLPSRFPRVTSPERHGDARAPDPRPRPP